MVPTESFTAETAVTCSSVVPTEVGRCKVEPPAGERFVLAAGFALHPCSTRAVASAIPLTKCCRVHWSTENPQTCQAVAVFRKFRNLSQKNARKAKTNRPLLSREIFSPIFHRSRSTTSLHNPQNVKSCALRRLFGGFNRSDEIPSHETGVPVVDGDSNRVRRLDRLEFMRSWLRRQEWRRVSLDRLVCSRMVAGQGPCVAPKRFQQDSSICSSADRAERPHRCLRWRATDTK